jgi:hypothetical protein
MTFDPTASSRPPSDRRHPDRGCSNGGGGHAASSRPGVIQTGVIQTGLLRDRASSGPGLLHRCHPDQPRGCALSAGYRARRPGFGQACPCCPISGHSRTGHLVYLRERAIEAAVGTTQLACRISRPTPTSGAAGSTFEVALFHPARAPDLAGVTVFFDDTPLVPISVRELGDFTVGGFIYLTRSQFRIPESASLGLHRITAMTSHGEAEATGLIQAKPPEVARAGSHDRIRVQPVDRSPALPSSRHASVRTAALSRRSRFLCSVAIALALAGSVASGMRIHDVIPEWACWRHVRSNPGLFRRTWRSTRSSRARLLAITTGGAPMSLIILRGYVTVRRGGRRR